MFASTEVTTDGSSSSSTAAPSAAVIEFSAASLRAGLAGEASPQIEIPLAIGLPKTEFCSGQSLTNVVSSYALHPLNPLELQQDVELLRPVNYDDETGRYEITNLDAFVAALSLLLGSDNSSYFNGCSLAELPLLIPDPALNDSNLRRVIGEVLFEQLDVTAAYFCKQPTLSTFACGRTSSIVFDSGHSRTTASVTVEGFTLPKSVVETPVGGGFLSSCILRYFETAKGKKASKDGRVVKLNPGFSYDKETKQSVRKSFITDSYWNWGVEFIADNLKIKRCEIEIGEERTQPRYYSLPDGTNIDTKSFCTSVPEVLFTGVESDIVPSYFSEAHHHHRHQQQQQQNQQNQPFPLFCDSTSDSSTGCEVSSSRTDEPTAGGASLTNQQRFRGCLALIEESVNLSELLGYQKNREALDSLILTGGNICFPNFITRVTQEISQKASNNTNCTNSTNNNTTNINNATIPTNSIWTNPQLKLLYTPDPALRRYTTFIGGSILGSLGSCQQLFITKFDYDEFSGSNIFDRRSG